MKKYWRPEFSPSNPILVGKNTYDLNQKMKTMMTDSLYSIFRNVMDCIRQIWCSKKCEKNGKKSKDNKKYSTYPKIIWPGNELFLIDRKNEWHRFKVEKLSFPTVPKSCSSEAYKCISQSIENSRKFRDFFDKTQKFRRSNIFQGFLLSSEKRISPDENEKTISGESLQTNGRN